MLTLTTDATQAIEQILTDSQVPDGAGVRIAATGSGNDGSPPAGELQIAVVEEPGGDDAVIQDAGARVFVDDAVSEFLADKTLDVAVEDERLQFMLSEQA